MYIDLESCGWNKIISVNCFLISDMEEEFVNNGTNEKRMEKFTHTNITMNNGREYGVKQTIQEIKIIVDRQVRNLVKAFDFTSKRVR